MPYNVIALSSTAFASFFGAMLSTLLGERDSKGEKMEPPSLAIRLYKQVTSIFSEHGESRKEKSE